ncbi:MAG: LacI family transcriptional regulator [Nocardioidaceae bacterium]|nr:LacI family transcriptional regulator [Nocardioidaceae bacterium]
MPKRPTLQDVADAVGLAPATVSYALRGERGSVETVARIQAAADELGYQVDPIARALASGRSRSVAVLCGSTRDLWQQSLSAELARSLMAEGRHALMADADGDHDNEVALLAKLRDQRPDGFLVAPLDPFAPHWEQLASQVPVVSIGDRLSQAPSSGAVVFDNARGFALVFEHLAELGHQRIAVVLPRRPSTPDRPAEELVAHWARRTGIEVDLVRTPPATADPDVMTNHLAAVLEDSGAGRPTAAFCFTDSFAFGVLRAARQLGLSVPDDLSVVGFEDVEFADLAGPGLTTVDWGRGTVVDAAVSQLLAAVDREEPLTTRTIEPRLVVRGSTGRRTP